MKKKTGIIKERILKIGKTMLAVATIFTSLQIAGAPQEVQAASYSKKTMMLWNDESSRRFTASTFDANINYGAWRGNKVYWGNTGAGAMAWAMLNPNGTEFNDKEGPLLLLAGNLGDVSESTLDNHMDEKFNLYLKEYEKNATLESSRNEIKYNMTTPLPGDQTNPDPISTTFSDNFSKRKWFAPTARMVMNKNYGFSDIFDEYQSRRTLGAGIYFLSSRASGYTYKKQFYVKENLGRIEAGKIFISDGYAAACPATKLDSDAILFISKAVGVTGQTKSTIVNNYDDPLQEYKFTLKDTSQELIVDSVSSLGNIATVKYSKTGPGTSLNAIITDKDGMNIMQYNKIATIPANDVNDQTATFELPTGFHENGYKLQLFTEINGGDKATDLASMPVEEEVLIDVDVNETNFPDATFRQWVLDKVTSGATVMTVDMAAACKEINLSNKNIKDMTGIKYFRDLTSLNVDDNELKNLDVSKNKKLLTLSCNNNHLAALKGVAASVTTFSGTGQTVDVTTVNRTYDVTTYDANFDGTKVSEIANATVKGNKLEGLRDKAKQLVTYNYDGGNGNKINVTFSPTVPEQPDYTVKFNPDNGEMIPDKESVKWSDTGLLPTTNPIKNGYKFDGWKIKDNEMVISDTTSYASLVGDVDTVTEITLDAQWKKIEYKLTFNPDNGDEKTSTPNVGWDQAGFVAPTLAAKPGHIFDEWKVQGKDVATFDETTKFSEMANNDQQEEVVIKAIWIENSNYTVKFDKNGATSADIANKTGVKWTAKGTDLLATAPTKTGYSFAGWKIKDTETIVDDTTTYASLVADVDTTMEATLVAQWSPVEYTVTYDKNGATSADIAPRTDVLYEDADLLASAPRRHGYTFDGWYLVDKKVEDDTKYKDLVADDTIMTVELQAHWLERTDFVITYDYNLPAMPRSVNKKENIRWTAKGTELLPTDLPTSAGHRLSGWKVKGTSDLIDAADTYGMLTGNDDEKDITLVAVWEEVGTYQVNYDTDGGGTIASKSDVAWSTKGLLPSSLPAKGGVVFDKWIVSGDASETAVTVNDTYAFLAQSEKASITLKAIYKATTYNVEYNVNGGTPTSIDKKTNVNWTDTTLLPAQSLTRKGHTFDGWYVDTTKVLDSTAYSALAKDGNQTTITLTAKWNENATYKVNYDVNGATSGAITPRTGVSYSSTDLLPTAPTKTGYKLEGWVIKGSLLSSKDYVTNATTYGAISNDGDLDEITLEARWRKDDGSIDVGDTTIKPNDEGDLPEYNDDGNVIVPEDGKVENPGGNFELPEGGVTNPDGSVTIPNDGSIEGIPTDGTTTLPEGGTLNPDGTVTLPNDGGITTPDGDITLPDGGTINPDGTIDVPNGGTVTTPGGEVTLPEGGTINPDGTIDIPNDGSVERNPSGPTTTLPEGGTLHPDGSIDLPNDGGITTPEGDITLPDGGTMNPDGTIDVPNGGTVETPGGEVTLPEGGTINPDGSIDIPNGGSIERNPSGPTTTLPEGGTLNPDGTVTLPNDGGITTPGGDVTLPDGGTVKPDGSIDVPNGGTVETPNGEVTLPEGGTIKPDGSIDLPNNGGITTPEGDVTLPDGGTIKPDGNIDVSEGGEVSTPGGEVSLPNGGLIKPDGSINIPNRGGVSRMPNGPTTRLPGGGSLKPGGSIDVPNGGGITTPEGDITLPEGGTVKPDGSIDVPNGGGVTLPGGDISLPGGGTIQPDGNIDVPNGGGVSRMPNGPTTTLPGGGSLKPGGSIDIPNGGGITTPEGDIILPEGGTVKPDGSIDVPNGGGVTLPGGDISLPEGGTIQPDGNIDVPNGGGVTTPDGTVTLPGGGSIKPDGSINIPNGGGVTTPDGTVTLPGGGTWNPNGSINIPNGGGVSTPDGTVTLPGGGTWNPNGSINIPNGGGVSTPDGTITLPGGGTWNPDGSITIPNGGGISTPNGDITLPEGGTWNPNGTITIAPGGSIVTPNGTVSLPEGGIMNADGSITVGPGGSIVAPDGTITSLPEGGTQATDILKTGIENENMKYLGLLGVSLLAVFVLKKKKKAEQK